MSFKLPENVQETTTTEGTGQLTLLGAVTGSYAFSRELSNGDTCFYTISDGTDFESGIGTYSNTSGQKLSRDTVIKSTNGNSQVNWATGTRNVFVGLPGDAVASLLAPLMANGFIVKIAGRTYTSRTLQGGADIVITNGDGVSANPSVAVSRPFNSDTVDGKDATDFLWDTDLGSIVQAWSSKLDTLAALSVVDGTFIVGNGTTFVAESGATARASLGLGSLATLSSVGQGQIDSSSVGTAELKSSNTTVVVTGSQTGRFTPSIGQWGFYPRMYWSSASGTDTGSWIQLFDSSVASTARFSTATPQLMASNQHIFNMNIVFEYLTSSPPYDLGDGEVPLFIWLLIENGSGKILGMEISNTPTWAYNGPTDIRPDYISPDGRKYKEVWIPETAHDADEVAVRAAILNARRTTLKDRLQERGIYAHVEIGHWMKNADMALLPHPWAGQDLTGKSVLLADPMSPLMERLDKEHAMGADVGELFTEGFIKFGGQVKRACPDGVKTVSIKYK